MTERWLPIEDFEGYEVSDHGRVRSWWGHTCGPRVRLAEPKLTAGSGGSESSPYLRITISANGRKHTRRIHQCVLTAFVGPRPRGKWGLHGDGNPLNNRLSNLRWGTPKDNAADRTVHGRTMFGRSNHKARLSAEAVTAIRAAHRAGAASQVSLAQAHGVSQAAISALILRKTWRQQA